MAPSDSGVPLHALGVGKLRRSYWHIAAHQQEPGRFHARLDVLELFAFIGGRTLFGRLDQLIHRDAVDRRLSVPIAREEYVLAVGRENRRDPGGIAGAMLA